MEEDEHTLPETTAAMVVAGELPAGAAPTAEAATAELGFGIDNANNDGGGNNELGVGCVWGFG